MNLASFILGNGRHAFGRIEGEQVIPMGDDLVAYLRGVETASDSAPVPLAAVRLVAPVPRPSKVICIGLNYEDHAEETGLKVTDHPLVFGKWANSVVGPDADVPLPACGTQFDFEVELGVVIGREGRRIPERSALEYVAGYTVVNDLSARDLQFSASQWTYGKAIDGFLPSGPVLVTRDEFGDPQGHALGTNVNGVARQQSSTSRMIFSVEAIISYVSQVMTLEPGDIIATGTPSGVAMAAAEPEWLKAGDTVETWIEGIGSLTTRLIPPL